MDEEVFVLFSCDEWKSHSSMSLLGVFDESNLKKAVKKKLEYKDFELGVDVEELDDMSIHDIEVSLEYGYIERVDFNQLM